MGGNIAVRSVTGEMIYAKKVDLKTISRSNFIGISKKLFKYLNTLYQAKFGSLLWPDETQIDKSTVFNGSASFIMSNNYADDEILKYKPYLGDIDISVPITKGASLFDLLWELRGRKVIRDVEYIGSNKELSDVMGGQINTLFCYTVDNREFLVQIDFELLPFEADGAPTEWARFSHSSSFVDTKAGVKAVHHKYLIRALIGALSVRDDIIVVTPGSKSNNPRPSKKDAVVRMLKFSVDKGVRIAYRPLLDDFGNQVILDGKPAYKEIPTKDSEYNQTVEDIFTMIFGDPEGDDLNNMWTFVGVLDICKKHLSRTQIKITADRYFELLWGSNGGQKLERDNPELDAEIKGAGWGLFCKALEVSNPSNFEEILNDYYRRY